MGLKRLCVRLCLRAASFSLRLFDPRVKVAFHLYSFIPVGVQGPKPLTNRDERFFSTIVFINCGHRCLYVYTLLSVFFHMDHILGHKYWFCRSKKIIDFATMGGHLCCRLQFTSILSLFWIYYSTSILNIIFLFVLLINLYIIIVLLALTLFIKHSDYSENLMRMCWHCQQ